MFTVHTVRHTHKQKQEDGNSATDMFAVSTNTLETGNCIDCQKYKIA